MSVCCVAGLYMMHAEQRRTMQPFDACSAFAVLQTAAAGIKLFEVVVTCALQVYRPLEFLFTIAAFTTLAENFLPQLIALPKVRRHGLMTHAGLEPQSSLLWTLFHLSTARISIICCI